MKGRLLIGSPSGLNFAVQTKMDRCQIIFIELLVSHNAQMKTVFCWVEIFSFHLTLTFIKASLKT